MRLLHVTHRFLPRYLAGTEVYAGLVAGELARRGHAVRLFTGDPAAQAAAETTWQGLPVTTVPWGWPRRSGPVSTFLAGFANPPVERRFARLLDTFQPEVVHFHHLLGLSPRLPALARRRGARVVVTLHDYWFVCANTWLFRWNRQVCPGPGVGYHCGGCALHRLGRRPHPVPMGLLAPVFAARTAVLRGALRQAHCLICPSRAVLEQYAAQGVPRDRLVVLPHGVQPGPAPAAAPPAALPPPVRFVYVGSLTPPKGLHTLIQAFNRLGEHDARLDLYGDPAADPAYAAELRAAATHPGIMFCGPAPRDQVDQVLRGAHVVVLPSLWEEPFSITIDEAWRAGRPVLASDRGAPKERIVPGVSGWTVPAGDVGAWHRQMQALISAPDWLAGLSQMPRPLKRLDEHVRELEALYRPPSPVREN